jgi:uncharacterized protein
VSSELKQNYECLRSFSERSSRSSEALGFAEIQGFLFTIASAPEMVPLSEWNPIIFGETGPNFEDIEQAQSVLGDLMALYNEINRCVLARSPAPLHDCPFREPVLANFEEDAPISQWARGFVHGHLWLEEVWDEYLPDALDEEFSSLAMVLSFFATRSMAEAHMAETGRPVSDLEETAALMRDLFADATRDYANIGRTIHEILSGRRGAREESLDLAGKVGRNDPCPCGSGKKFKRCHGGGRD